MASTAASSARPTTPGTTRLQRGRHLPRGDRHHLAACSAPTAISTAASSRGSPTAILDGAPMRGADDRGRRRLGARHGRDRANRRRSGRPVRLADVSGRSDADRHLRQDLSRHRRRTPCSPPPAMPDMRPCSTTWPARARPRCRRRSTGRRRRGGRRRLGGDRRRDRGDFRHLQHDPSRPRPARRRPRRLRRDRRGGRAHGHDAAHGLQRQPRSARTNGATIPTTPPRRPGTRCSPSSAPSSPIAERAWRADRRRARAWQRGDHRRNAPAR